MKQELTELERLDLAARAQLAAASSSRLKWILAGLAVMSVVLAMPSEAPHFEILAVRVFASIVVLVALMSWLAPWRYTLYGWVALWFVLAVMTLVVGPENSHSLAGWIWRIAMALCFAGFGYEYLRRWAWIGLYAKSMAVHGDGWQRERAQVRQWFTILINQVAEEPVLEIATGNFWRGYFTYRMMSRDGVWVVARFKNRNYFRVLDYRILGPDAVKMVQGNKLNIEIDHRVIELDISPEIRASLLRCTGAS